MLTEKDHTHCNCHEDLFAAVRSERPPEVTPAPYAKTIRTSKGKQTAGPSVNKRVTTRTHIEEIAPTPVQPNNATQIQQQVQPRQEPIETDIQMEERSKPKKPRAKRSPPEIRCAESQSRHRNWRLNCCSTFLKTEVGNWMQT